ncbi:MAG TPA: type II toxin-antitoxin system VapC family toxin [Isosphaeraceae bacterium]|jgi:tRNA(fMet)-specific endonuclease VapC|nr:type II toxin-antitoxin system VapC family toxin [Isosphaeraceae bacterium]
MSYLLDTNACIQYLRQRDSAIVARIASMTPASLRLCSVVKAELYHGACCSQQVGENLVKVENFVRPFLSLPFDDDAAREYGHVRYDLQSRGVMIGPHDLQIAVIALIHGLTLVTHNTREFSQVTGLMLEDWQTAP